MSGWSERVQADILSAAAELGELTVLRLHVRAAALPYTSPARRHRAACAAAPGGARLPAPASSGRPCRARALTSPRSACHSSPQPLRLCLVARGLSLVLACGIQVTRSWHGARRAESAGGAQLSEAAAACATPAPSARAAACSLGVCGLSRLQELVHRGLTVGDILQGPIFNPATAGRQVGRPCRTAPGTAGHVPLAGRGGRAGGGGGGAAGRAGADVRPGRLLPPAQRGGCAGAAFGVRKPSPRP